MPNPFIYEDAVPPDKFFNRDREVGFFSRLLLSGKRRLLVAIVGPLKFGKTSLMLRYLEVTSKYEDIIPVYIDLRKHTAPIRRIASAVLGRDGLERSYARAKESAESLDELFGEIDEALKGAGKWLFVFFDEFHLLPKRVWEEGFLLDMPEESDVFLFFRAAAENRRISYIVCGSAVESLMGALDAWGGRFQTIYLGPFSKGDAVRMMRSLFSEGGMEPPDEFLEELCDAAGYHPFYMQFMGSIVYSMGGASRLALREAKKSLWEYVKPIFAAYLERLANLGEDYLMVLAKIARREPLTWREEGMAAKLLRMGFIRMENSRYEVVDPLFRRMVLNLSEYKAYPDVVVVGHWAERIVGNYLVKKGYIPYYSHDSRGAFDIYVRVRDVDVGIQVRYSTSGEAYLSDDEAEKIVEAARETGWKPLLALVSRDVEFFSDIRPGSYRAGHGFKEIEEAISGA